MKQQIKKQRALSREQRYSGDVRKAYEIQNLLEHGEKEWERHDYKSKRETEKMKFEESTPVKVSLPSMNGYAAGAFIKRMNKAIKYMKDYNIIATSDGYHFYIPLLKVSDPKHVFTYGGSNKVPDHLCTEVYAQISYQEDAFNLWGPNDDEPIYIAETWIEFKEMLKAIPVLFSNRLKNGRLKYYSF